LTSYPNATIICGLNSKCRINWCGEEFSGKVGSQINGSSYPEIGQFPQSSEQGVEVKLVPYTPQNIRSISPSSD
jgi:hypothetical protein